MPHTLRTKLTTALTYIRFPGLLTFGLAVFFGLALGSFNLDDPSANLVSEGPVHNRAGWLGAYVANPLLQFLGIASAAIPLIVGIWGIKLLTKRPVSYGWLRFAALLLCLPPLAGMFDAIDVPESWPFQSMGGFIGHYLYNTLIYKMPVAAYLGAMGVLGMLFGVFATGLTLMEYKAVGERLWMLVRLVGLTLCWTALRLARLARRKPAAAQETEAPKPASLVEFTQSARPARKRAPKKEEAQPKLKLLPEQQFEMPSMELLKAVAAKAKKTQMSESALSQNARLLEKVLDDFGINGKILKIRPGPVVTLYELEPSAGTKSSRVVGLADDIARSMSAISTRIAVIPGRNAIGIELPNSQRETVLLRETLETDEYRDENIKLPLSLGKDIGGAPIIADLAKMPHLLVAGTTGSGKSVAINVMILSLLYRLRPDQCKFIMIDPKMLELSVYDGIPHLLTPVVTEPGKAVVALKWVTREMENRYRLMSNLGVRNIAGYNKRIEEAAAKGEKLERTVQTGFEPDTGKPIFEKVPLDSKPLPYIVVIVDEMADLMLVAGKDIESSIQRLAQMARAAGIHIIMATQRPSVDVITGVIKANFPTRISFQVTSRIDSRTILGEQGAEQLLGMGDMLYMSGGSRITRIHGPFVDDKEVEGIVNYLKTQGEPTYIEEVTVDDGENAEFGGEGGGSGDDLYDRAVAIVQRDRKASTSYLQRQLKIGYNRAADLIDRMEREGVVTPANHVGKREVVE